MDILDKQKYIFIKMFLLSNKLQVVGDQTLGGEMTIRQWLFTVAVARYVGGPPALSEVAEVLGCSHQNAKQLATKLRDSEFIIMEKDRIDQRITRVLLTQKSCLFWEKSQQNIRNLLEKLFGDISEDEIEVLYTCLNKLFEGVLKMKKE